jgi:hypothetical protein
VAAFNDARASTAFAVVDGRQVASEGNLGAVVQEGLERYLRDAGVRVVLTGGALVEGEIVEWRANIKPSFPTSDVTAVARIKVTVRDPRTNALGYRGTFSGEASVSDPILTEREVQKLLTEAMRSALQALLKEESFMAQIAAGS